MTLNSEQAPLISPFPFALGLLRLSTEGRPVPDEAVAILHAALDAGVRWFDTADSYCLDEKEKHYGETLAMEAVRTWKGPANEVVIATKVGMLRPKGKWVPDGSPKQIRKGVDGSLQALGVDRIPWLQLHARDPRVPFEETLGTLAELRSQGKIDRIGLCNVDPLEVRQAIGHFPVASIQNELSLLSRSAATCGGVLQAQQLGIPFLAYRPLGGYAKVAKLKGNRVLAPLSKKHSVTPEQMALAVMLDQGSPIVPLLGVRRMESLIDSLAAIRIQLDDEDREWIRSKVSFDADEEAKMYGSPRMMPLALRKLEPNAGAGQLPEVVLLMGIQGAGKSALVKSYTDAGYRRLNRDTMGGSLSDLIPTLTQWIDEGEQRIVLDNTYPTRTSRMPVLDAAHYFGIPVRCRYLATPLHEARINVAWRIFERYGKMLGPDEMKDLAKQDPNLPPPIAMQRWAESFEIPSMEEGFSAVDILPFERKVDPTWKAKGLLLDVDGTLRKTKSGELYPRSAEDVEILPGRQEILQRWIQNGYQLFFVSNQSGISSGKLTVADAELAFQRTVELLGLPICDIAYCPHSAFPAGCFCRKPMPGLAVSLIIKHHLDLSELVMVGDLGSDKEFARGIGARYFEAAKFFEEA